MWGGPWLGWSPILVGSSAKCRKSYLYLATSVDSWAILNTIFTGRSDFNGLGQPMELWSSHIKDFGCIRFKSGSVSDT